MSAEYRDSWECPACGSGYCTPRGVRPTETAHGEHGAYVLEGPCSCSPDHPKYDPEQDR